MKKIRHFFGTYLFKYALVMTLIIMSVLTLVTYPEIYRICGNYNVAPVISFVFIGLATMVWNSVDD